jgi:hypothetical protein
MENFPTPSHHRVLPWATNICTLAVMVAATWWSSAQRPPLDALELTSEATMRATEKEKQILRQPVAALSPVVPQAGWPTKTSSIQTDAVETVGYSTGLLR